jgi:ubiquitin related modifier 1
MSQITLKIQFGGGLELLFSNNRNHRISVPSRVPLPTAAAPSDAAPSTGVEQSSSGASADDTNTKPTDVNYLIHWLKDNLLRERPELFIEEGTVCVSSDFKHPSTDISRLLLIDDLEFWS